MAEKVNLTFSYPEFICARYTSYTYFLTLFIMRSVNKVILMGHLAVDPEVRQLQNGHALTSFKVATNRDWRSSDGERKEATDYHKIVAWRKLGEACAQYLKKGSAVYMEGRLMNHQYTDKKGIDRFGTEIVADKVNFISYKKNADAEEINLVEVKE